jgi:hypothetical protein
MIHPLLVVGNNVCQQYFQFHMYADANRLYILFFPSTNAAVNFIEHVDVNTSERMDINRLTLNGSNTKPLLIGAPQQ